MSPRISKVSFIASDIIFQISVLRPIYGFISMILLIPVHIISGEGGEGGGVVGRSIQGICKVLSNVYLYLDILIVITYHINCVSIHKDTFIYHLEFYVI